MIRNLGAALLVLHGAIHLIGFVVPWRIAEIAGSTYRTTALGGIVEVGDTGARLIGLVWLGLAIGFVAAGFGVWRRASWAIPLTAALAVGSLAVCTLGLPETAAGILVNVAILAVAVRVVLRRPRRGQDSPLIDAVTGGS